MDEKTFEELKPFDDFEGEQSTIVMDSTDEIRATGFVKEATARGKSKEWTKERFEKHHPNIDVTIIPKLVQYEKGTKWVKSIKLTTKETSDSTKRLLFTLLAFVLLLSTGISLTASLKRSMRVLQKPLPYTNTDLKKPKKTLNSSKSPTPIKTKSSMDKGHDKPRVEENHEPSLYESIMDEVQ